MPGSDVKFAVGDIVRPARRIDRVDWISSQVPPLYLAVDERERGIVTLVWESPVGPVATVWWGFMTPMLPQARWSARMRFEDLVRLTPLDDVFEWLGEQGKDVKDHV